MNLKKLREVAERATPGPWHIAHQSEIDSTCEIAGANGVSIGEIELPENRLYLCAANPRVVLALLDCVDALDEARNDFSVIQSAPWGKEQMRMRAEGGAYRTGCALAELDRVLGGE